MSLTSQQKAQRQHGVGASEVLAALGKDSRCSRLELYLRKRGERREKDLGEDERVYFGALFEPILRKEFARRAGVRVIQRHATLQHRAAPLLGHIDGWIPAERCGVEIKTADRFEAEDFGEPGSDQVPVRYVVQCSAYMAITDAEQWHLAVLIGGNDFRTYRIPRDDVVEQMILAGVREFWSHVDAHRPPDPHTPEEIRLRWPKDFGTSIVATDEILKAAAHLAEAKIHAKEWATICTEQTGIVQRFMQENAQLLDENDKILATWRTARPSMRLDVDAFETDHPSLYQQYLREVPGSRRFLLK